MPVVKEAMRVVVYADNRTALGQEALRLLEGSSHVIVRIPTAGGLPFATRGPSRYNGLDEIRTLAAELQGHR